MATKIKKKAKRKEKYEKISSLIKSKKHGLNPTIPLCFWCGQEKDAIAVLGKLPDDKEAPRNMVIDYEPCSKCARIFDAGKLCVEVSSKPVHRHQAPIEDGKYPTGRYIVLDPKLFGQLRNVNYIFEQDYKDLFDFDS